MVKRLNFNNYLNIAAISVVLIIAYCYASPEKISGIDLQGGCNNNKCCGSIYPPPNCTATPGHTCLLTRIACRMGENCSGVCDACAGGTSCLPCANNGACENQLNTICYGE